VTWEDRLLEALGEQVLPVVVWARSDAPDLVVYAFSSVRLATLRHWRDEVETASFVALEASKWARLLLKGHGGSLLSSAQPPTLDCIETGSELGALAEALWTADASHWAGLVGIPPLALPNPPLSPEERFERVERWLTRVRSIADATRS
jgi:hypothetical protein